MLKPLPAVKANDIDLLLEVLENLNNVFSVFFSDFPEFGTTKKSGIEKTIEILRFYAKMKKFITYVS